MRQVLFSHLIHGAPLERIGNWVETPYAAALARLGQIRSAGVTDLRYGNLMDEDWQGRDRFARAPDTRRAMPLPDGVACYSIAAVFFSRAAMDSMVWLASVVSSRANDGRRAARQKEPRVLGFASDALQRIARLAPG